MYSEENEPVIHGTDEYFWGSDNSGKTAGITVIGSCSRRLYPSEGLFFRYGSRMKSDRNTEV